MIADKAINVKKNSFISFTQPGRTQTSPDLAWMADEAAQLPISPQFRKVQLGEAGVLPQLPVCVVAHPGIITGLSVEAERKKKGQGCSQWAAVQFTIVEDLVNPKTLSLPEKLWLVFQVFRFQLLPPLSLQLFYSLFLLLCSLQVSLLQQSASDTWARSLCAQSSVHIGSSVLLTYSQKSKFFREIMGITPQTKYVVHRDLMIYS